MFIVREVMHCRPGKVRELINKFRMLSAVMERHGLAPFRIATDVCAEQFWTMVAETQVERLDQLIEGEARVMADPEAQAAMFGYHDLVERGRREIYRVEG